MPASDRNDLIARRAQCHGRSDIPVSRPGTDPEYLQSVHGHNASGEQDFGNGTRVDVATGDGDATSYVYYELETGLSARICIRDAIGQLLEYSYWPGAQQANKLVIVAEAPDDNEAKTYIENLRKEFSLPIEYRQFDMKSRRLV